MMPQTATRGSGRTTIRRLNDRLFAREFLLAHLRRDRAPERLVPPTPAQWICVLEEAISHRLAPLIYRRIADGPWADSMPADLFDQLRAIHVATALRNALLLRETAHAARLLAAENIPTLLLKGIHLAHFVFPESGLRSMADIDLMVPRNRLADAERIFVADGFGPLPRPDLEKHCAWSNHLPVLEKPGAERLEIHYAIERPTSPFPIDTEELWRQARSLEVQGVPVFALSNEHLLLHLCLHTAYHHQFERSALKALVDVATIVEHATPDWDVVVQTANRWGAGAFVYSTLRLVQDVLAAPVPRTATDPLDHDADDDAVIRTAARYILAPAVTLPDAYVQTTRRESTTERVALLFRGVFLPPAQMRRMYGLSAQSLLVWPFYLFRLIDLLARRGGLLLRLAFRTRAVEPTLERLEDRKEIERWVDRLSRSGV